MNYYCLIAGLPDIQLEDTKVAFSLLELKRELFEQLSVEDIDLLKLIFAKYDNENWLKYIENKDVELNPLGNLKQDDLSQILALLQEFEHPKDSRLLPYIQQFHSTYNDEKFLLEGISREDYLSGLYYEFAMQNKNSFLKAWFEFNLNVNNILTAIACRKHDFDQRTMVLGTNEIAQTLRTSNARDFGLTGVFDKVDEVLRLAEETDLLEREKKLDALKWNWLEENTFFSYFGVEKILAFGLKSEMIERWNLLSVERGTEIFRELLGSMKEGISFE